MTKHILFIFSFFISMSTQAWHVAATCGELKALTSYGPQKDFLFNAITQSDFESLVFKKWDECKNKNSIKILEIGNKNGWISDRQFYIPEENITLWYVGFSEKSAADSVEVLNAKIARRLNFQRVKFTSDTSTIQTQYLPLMQAATAADLEKYVLVGGVSTEDLRKNAAVHLAFNKPGQQVNDKIYSLINEGNWPKLLGGESEQLMKEIETAKMNTVYFNALINHLSDRLKWGVQDFRRQLNLSIDDYYASKNPEVVQAREIEAKLEETLKSYYQLLPLPGIENRQYSKINQFKAEKFVQAGFRHAKDFNLEWQTKFYHGLFSYLFMGLIHGKVKPSAFYALPELIRN